MNVRNVMAMTTGPRDRSAPSASAPTSDGKYEYNLAAVVLLVAVNVTTGFGPTVQAAAFTGVVLSFWRAWRVSFTTLAVVCVAYISLQLGIAWMVRGVEYSEAVIRSGKILPLLMLYCTRWLGVGYEKRLFTIVRSRAPIYLRAYTLLCVVNLALALSIGMSLLRAQVVIEYTIYASYTLVVLYAWESDRVTLIDTVATGFFCVMLGSTMGVALLVLVEVVRNIKSKKFWRIFYLVLVTIPLAALLQYVFTVRDREVSFNYLVSSDRGVLISSSLYWIGEKMNLISYVFGHGAGRPLDGFIVVADAGFDAWLKELQNGYYFSFGLHNEYLRVFIDYGLIGLVLISVLVWKRTRLEVAIVLGIAMMTNSYLYSFTGAVVVGIMLNSIRGPSRPGGMGRPRDIRMGPHSRGRPVRPPLVRASTV